MRTLAAHDGSVKFTLAYNGKIENCKLLLCYFRYSFKKFTKKVSGVVHLQPCRVCLFPWRKGSLTRVYYSKLNSLAHLHYMNIFFALKGSKLFNEICSND